jgi:PAS domain S-box-containing protein
MTPGHESRVERLETEALRLVGDPWQGLKTLVRARLLVATLALPVGVLLRPDATVRSWGVLAWALLATGVLSALFVLGVRLRRGLRLQIYLQLAADLLLVAGLAALTGGRNSQFVLFFALVVITGGLLGQVAGGLFAAAGACAAYLGLPAAMRLLGVSGGDAPDAALPRPGMLIAFLSMVGVLAGVLGERVQRTRHDLHRTARELDRVRVDNDVILRHLATGVLMVDEAGTVGYLNPAGEQVLEVRAWELRGRSIEAALPERLKPLRDTVNETLRRRVARARLELLMQTAGGVPLPVGISTNLLTHEGALTGVVAVFQDLTDVREMERRARRNQTLAEVGALAAGIAHELRNGLKPISGSVEYLQRELRPEGESAVLMDLIGAECARLNKFVTDLLSYSRDRELAPENLDLDEVLAELSETVARDPRCAAGITVRYERGGSCAVLSGDREQLRQVWLNLAANALEAMPRGGTLWIRWREGENEDLIVEFADDGAGIAAEDLPRAGQPFFTTKEGGTGLGLAIAQRIVERHGGTLALESAEGRGTTARVTLPARAVGVARAA